jgi:CxxC motif-containing protein (DUF1111 family)
MKKRPALFAFLIATCSLIGVVAVSFGSEGSDVLDISCGNSSAASPYVADTDFSGGLISAGTTNTITTTGITDPAPQAVYQHARNGDFTYTIPGLTDNGSYLVRLHFSENYWTAAGKRTFNVAINGTTVLSNFDIFANAGGEFIAIVEQFPATASSSGDITITATTVINESQINGIEIVHNGPVDPGPRTPGMPNAGGTFGTIDTNSTNNADDKTFFADTANRFLEIDSVTGTAPGTNGAGLGPTFNSDACASCHAFPVPGGTSPMVNPQLPLAHLDGATNSQSLSGILSTYGPVREVRFTNGTNGGSPMDLFSIQGRADAPGCTVAQNSFTAALSGGYAIFRIPTPLFGLGLVEFTPDNYLVDNLNSTASARAALGIGGEFNYSGNDNTITRFGWKAQNKSLMIFAGEAYAVEQGVSNELFPNERYPPGTTDSEIASCEYSGNGSPKDATNIDGDPFVSGAPLDADVSDLSSDVTNFAGFMELGAPPVAVTSGTSELNGQTDFSNIGCNLCHSPTLETGNAEFNGLSNLTYHPYSDFALHNMGPGLADNISQGNASGSQFRTAPLWGLGQRLFFLHDGRTSDLYQAIEDHASGSGSTASEANDVVANFNALTGSQQQDLLNFLRSL